ncbi:hypothetical protein BGZ99_005768 [Dissophora globulifera]|uniref:C2H2-type domain-containing protein n=1 Tax=Dissophora globulifera TaxID=979702 RepID=A0A9P6RSF9_9FUNG|nr:hypothetical protein BGZ99_005768 [Dissophora globulifera]
MSPYTQRQPVASMPQQAFFSSLDTSTTTDLSRYQLAAYGIVGDSANNNNPTANLASLASCGADLSGEGSFYQESDIGYFSGLPLHFPSAHELVTLAAAKRYPDLTMSAASTPRGVSHSGTDSLSLDELSIGIMTPSRNSFNGHSGGKGHFYSHFNNYSYDSSETKASNNYNNTSSDNSSSASIIFSASSSLSSSSPPLFTPEASTPASISTATGSSTSSETIDYLMTNHNYLLTQSNQHQHQQQQQQHQRRQQQDPSQEYQPGTSASDNTNRYTHDPTPAYIEFSPDEFQGVACSGNSSHLSTYSSTPWNVGIALTASNEAHLTTSAAVSANSFPEDAATSMATTTTTATVMSDAGMVTWTNRGALNGVTVTQMQSTSTAGVKDNCKNEEDASHLQRLQQQQQQQQHRSHSDYQIQHPSKQARSYQLQIMTTLESGVATMYTNSTSDNSNTAAGSPMHPSITGHPYMNHRHHQHQGQPYSIASSSSPVESCFNSGSSTPSFASSSSSLSHLNSELGHGTPSAYSCDSSRPTSPSSYDGYLSERRLYRSESESTSSSFIVRSRKSSTSSTSSVASSHHRRMSTLRESTTGVTSTAAATTTAAGAVIIGPSSSSLHQCPKCGQSFAGPAVLVRHIESIHDKLLWNCVGCKSNLSRRDAVTRHINLSPMDSVCRAVGTIGQIKMLNGTEILYEVSPYRAKPLDEVMSRMGKKISTALRREIDMAKARTNDGTTAMGETELTPASIAMGPPHMPTLSIEFPNCEIEGGNGGEGDGYVLDAERQQQQQQDEMIFGGFCEMDEYEEDEDDGQQKKRRRSLLPTLVHRKK